MLFPFVIILWDFSRDDLNTFYMSLPILEAATRGVIKINVLENFAKFTEKHLCQSLFVNKVAGLRPATLLKKRLAQVFFCYFCDIFKNTSFSEYLWKTAFAIP